MDAGINVVLTAHAQIRKFEQPDELGAYDRWELKLGKKTQSQTSPLVKEWTDLLLFANYKTFSVAVDKDGKKHKAQGGKRVMYTTHHPCWDAKNRYGLAEELPFDYGEIAHIIKAVGDTPANRQEAVAIEPPVSESEPPAIGEQKEESELPPFMSQETMREEPAPPPRVPERDRAPENAGKPDAAPAGGIPSSLPENIPKALRDLMEANGVDEWDIQNVVAARGYYPADTPIQAYDPDFIEGVLVGAWEKVYRMIREMKETDAIPFN